jgi:hypothetical protein
MMLCTHQHDIEHELSSFLHRLLDRGYTLLFLLAIFLSAEQKALTHQSNYLQPQTNPQQTTHNNATFLHLQFHPANPPSTNIQHIWCSTISTPPAKPPLYNLRNREGHLIDIKCLTIAYSRAPNLGNILSCCILRTGIRDYTDRHTHPMLFQHDEDETEGTPPTHPTI